MCVGGGVKFKITEAGGDAKQIAASISQVSLVQWGISPDSSKKHVYLRESPV